MRVRLGVGLRHGGARPLLIFPGGEHKGARLATWAAAPVHLLRAKVSVRVRVIGLALNQSLSLRLRLSLSLSLILSLSLALALITLTQPSPCAARSG